MAGLAAKAALVALLGLALPAAHGATFYVVDGGDDNYPNGFCNGQNCDMRGAFNGIGRDFGGQDQIWVQTDVILKSALVNTAYTGTLRISNQFQNDTRTIRAYRSPGQITTSRFILMQAPNIDTYLILDDLVIEGFRPETHQTSSVHGGAIYFSIGALDNDLENVDPKMASKPMGEIPVLAFYNCKFIGNSAVHHDVDHASIGGGAVAIGGCRSGCKVIIENTIFRNNSLENALNAFGSAIWANHGVNLAITDSTFSDNYLSGCKASGGTIFYNYGSVNLTGCTFERNHGSNQGGTTLFGGGNNQGEDQGNLRAITTNFIDNFEGPIEQGKSPAVIAVNHLRLFQCAVVNKDAPLLVTSTHDDQYLSECSFLNLDGSAPRLGGFAVYNRNPVFWENLEVTAGPTSGGTAATCQDALPWFPCPTNTACKNLKNNAGNQVGYTCATI